ncbi:MAG TPA: YetF domain-containing protein [Rhodopila sp.]|nr:YetF domain-containing protein [Rhodopila sp.]
MREQGNRVPTRALPPTQRGLVMGGVDTVNDEFEVGFDQWFETKWHRAELVGHFVMVAFAMSAALGLLGRGPYSRRTAESADGAQRINYEPIARQGISSTVTVHVKNEIETNQPTRLLLSQRVIEPMGFQHAIRPANGVTVSDAGIRLNFQEQPHQKDALVRLIMHQLRLTGQDVMAAARQRGLMWLDQVRYAVAERDGKISIVQTEA